MNSPILQVAIGMMFFFLLLSLLCTSLNELLEAWLKNRARDLEAGIARMLDSAQGRSYIDYLGYKLRRLAAIIVRRAIPPRLAQPATTSLFYNHPFVQALFRDAKELPSYIPARTFALTIMDLACPNGTQGAAAVSTPVQAPMVVVNGQQPAALPAQAPAAAPNANAALIAALRQGVANNQSFSQDLKTALTALINASGDDPVRVRQNIEDWYNSTMDRVAGWYKRRTQGIVLVLGFTVAIVLNADASLAMQALWRDSALRSAVVTAAEQAVSNPNTAGSSDQNAKQQIAQSRAALTQLGLPIGSTIPTYLSWTLYQLDLHWLGWLVTALATSLGAPFWFDLLNRFIVVRSTVKPEEKSPDEPPKG